MIEIVVAVLCMIVGTMCAAVAFIALMASCLGGSENASDVNLNPAVAYALLALTGIGGGIAILIT